LGNPLPIWRTEDKQEEVLIGSIGELYNEIEKSIQAGFQKRKLLKDSEIDMDEANYDLVDLHKT
jgi:isoleucyl-tRNA synthetase